MRAADADVAFLTLGFQYYIVARAAALSGLLPVSGNLFHHAIEMFLKARLSQTHTLEELKKPRFRHSLHAAWNAFKAEVSGDILAQFDSTIDALQRFESVRWTQKFGQVAK